MKRQDTQSIESVLKQMFQDPQYAEKLGEARVLELWPEVTDEVTKRRTTQIYVKNRKLFVRVSSPALKSNLLMQVKALTATLNEKAGAEVIDSIVLL